MTDDDRTNAQPTEAAPEEPEAAQGPRVSPEQAAEERADQQPEPQVAYEAPPSPEDMNVFDLLRAMIPLLVQEAWVALGLQARPGAADVHTDLRCARVAIDTTQALIEKLGDEATEEERREFEQVLTTLRVNFVRRQAKSEG